ncbi:MAG: hypothetical protein U0263_32600 [Polyangiaceae bacterium]
MRSYISFHGGDGGGRGDAAARRAVAPAQPTISATTSTNQVFVEADPVSDGRVLLPFELWALEDDTGTLDSSRTCAAVT